MAIIYEEWSKEGTAVNQRQADGRPRLSDAHEEQNKPADEVLAAKEVSTGSDKVVSDH